MTAVAKTLPPDSLGTTAEASRRSGLRAVQLGWGVKAGGGAPSAYGPVKFGNAAGGAGGLRVLGKLRLLSRRVRDAFQSQPAEDPAGDYPPSDCWPAEVCTVGGSSFGFVHHAVDYVAGPTLLSPDKCGEFIPLASEGGERAAHTRTRGGPRT